MSSYCFLIIRCLIFGDSLVFQEIHVKFNFPFMQGNGTGNDPEEQLQSCGTQA